MSYRTAAVSVLLLVVVAAMAQASGAVPQGRVRVGAHAGIDVGPASRVTPTVAFASGGQPASPSAVQTPNPSLLPGQLMYNLDLLNNTLLAGNVTPINGAYPESLAYDSRNGYLYVVGYPEWGWGLHGTITVIDTATNRPVTTLMVGELLSGIAFDDANGYLYVADMRSNNVTVIDAATNEIVALIPAGQGPNGVAFDSLNGNVYVTNYFGGGVTVIDGATNQVRGTVWAGANPQGIAFDRSNGYLYMANYMADDVSVIDGTTNTLVATIPVGRFPAGVVYDSSNGHVYVTNTWAPANVSVIDGATDEVIASIPMVYGAPYGPQNIAYDEADGFLYVADYYSNGPHGVEIIDGATNTVVRTVPAGDGPYGVVYDPSKDLVYVSNSFSSNTTVIAGSTGTIVASIPTGSEPTGIAFDNLNGNLYVPDRSTTALDVINSTTNRVVDAIPLAAVPSGLAFDSTNGYVYVITNVDWGPSPGGSNVTVIDGTTNRIVATIPVGLAPSTAVTFDTLNGELYVANCCGIEVIDGGTNKVVDTIPVVGNAIGFDPSNGNLYVSGGDNVTVIDGATNTIIGAVGVGIKAVVGIAFDNRTGYLYVPAWYSNNVTVIDGATNRVVGSIPVGENPVGVHYDELNDYVYVASCCGVDVIDGATNTVLGSVPSEFDLSGGYFGSDGYFHVSGGLFDPSNGYFYVPKGLSGAVTIIAALNLTFTESGLPEGTAWSVAVDGVRHVSTSDAIVLPEPVGIIGYSIGDVNGYAVTPSSGSVKIARTSVTVPIVFTPFPVATFDVTFTETGLPAGTTWSVALGGSTHTCPLGSMVFAEANGTYSFIVGAVAGHVAQVSYGNLTVAGRPIDEFVSFTPIAGSGSAGGSVGPSTSFLGLPVWAAYAVLAASGGIGVGTVVILLEIRRRRGSLPPRSPPKG